MKKLLLLFLPVVAAGLAAADGGLLPDGGFEQEVRARTLGTVRGLDLRGTWSRTPEAARNGQYGLKIVDLWENASPYPFFRVPAVKDAGGYRFRCLVKSPEKNQRFRMGICLTGTQNGSPRNFVWLVREFDAGPEWKEFAVETPNKPGTETVGVFIGATGGDKTAKGVVYADDAALETIAAPPPPIPRSSNTVRPLLYPAEFDAARVERHGQGWRLKAGQPSRVMDEAAAPDVTFRDVDVPKDGFYRFKINLIGARQKSFARLGVPDFPRSLVQIRDHRAPDRHWVHIGVFPLKKGKQTVTLSLPEKETVNELVGTWDGPMPLPEAIRNYPLKYVPQGRPRVWINREHLAVIRRNLDHPEFARAMKKLRAVADSPVKLVMKPGCEVFHQRALEDKLQAQAFFALVEDDAAKKREIAQTMHAYFTHLTGFPGLHLIYFIDHAFMTAAIVYDWCYEGFTPEQRKEMVTAYLNMACRQEGSWPPLRQSVLFGHGNELAPACLAFGIACFDEDPEIFRIMSYQIIEQLVPMRRYQFRSNAHPQGSWYGAKRLSGDLFMATLFRTACKKELFGDMLYRMPFYWQMLRLPDLTYFDEGDIWGYPVEPSSFPEFMLFCAAATRDPAYKGFYLAMDGDEREYVYHMILNDPEVKPVPPFSVRLPYSWYFGPFHGSMIARTGFYDDEAAVYFMGGGKHNGNHQHSDAGAFQIWYRGPLATDIGDYGSTYGVGYDANFNKRSLAHNMLRVYDPDEKFGGGRFDNDGGARFVYATAVPMTVEAYEKSAEHDYGTTRSVSIGPDKMRPAYSFLAADLTNAYSKKIKHYMRLFVFLNQQSKEQPAGFLVCDLVESAKPEFRKFFQVSSYYPPVLRKNFIGLATPGGGCADMRLYLPAETKITDFANEKSFVNPFSGKTYELPFPGAPANFAHRVEVTPEKRQAFDTFLAHFGIRAKDAAPLAEGYRDLGNAHLVRSGKFLVTLPKKDELVKTPLVLDVPEGGAQVLCTYLAPGPWHASGCNFMVKEGENTLFLVAKTGKLEVAPGRLDGAPDYQVPAACTPPDVPPDPAGIFLDGKKLNGKPLRADGQLLVPVTAFPGLPAFTEGRDTIRFNGVELKMPAAPKRIGGVLHIPARTAAGILRAQFLFDPITMRLVMTSFPPDAPSVLQVKTDHQPLKLLSLVRPDKTGGNIVAGGGGNWVAEKRYDFTLTLDRSRKLGGIAVTFPYGTTRRFPVRISGSMDGKTFHLLFEGLSAEGRRRTLFRWKPEVLRYLRVDGRSDENSPWISIGGLDFQMEE